MLIPSSLSSSSAFNSASPDSESAKKSPMQITMSNLPCLASMVFTFVASDEYAPRTGPTVRLSSFQTVPHGLFKCMCYILVVITVMAAPGDERKTGASTPTLQNSWPTQPPGTEGVIFIKNILGPSIAITGVIVLYLQAMQPSCDTCFGHAAIGGSPLKSQYFHLTLER
jgi:hypothetical protein